MDTIKLENDKIPTSASGGIKLALYVRNLFDYNMKKQNDKSYFFSDCDLHRIFFSVIFFI